MNDILRNPTALQAASLSAENALRGELIDRLLMAGMNVPTAMQMGHKFHARVVRVDEAETPHGRPHHGFALVLMADRTIYSPGTTARGVLEELTEGLLAVHQKTAHEALLPMAALMAADASVGTHPNLPSLHTLDKDHMIFGPSQCTPMDKDGRAPQGRIRSTLFARSIEDVLEGVNTQVKANRRVNMKLHEGRGV